MFLIFSFLIKYFFLFNKIIINLNKSALLLASHRVYLGKVSFKFIFVEMIQIIKFFFLQIFFCFNFFKYIFLILQIFYTLHILF